MNTEYYSSDLRMLQRTRRLARSSAGAGNTSVKFSKPTTPSSPDEKQGRQIPKKLQSQLYLLYQQQQLLGSSGLTESSINFSPTVERLSIQNLALNPSETTPRVLRSG
jgi:hypothetical protein